VPSCGIGSQFNFAVSGAKCGLQFSQMVLTFDEVAVLFATL